MVTRMDRDVGRIVSLVEELGLAQHTLIMFSSDNGPTFNGGTDSTFFNSAGPFRGLKCDLYEGGIRVPLVARWPGRVKPATRSDHVCAFWDLLPTLADVIGIKPPNDIDGISFLPALSGKPDQRPHEYLYWEYRSRGGNQAVRMGRWKGIRCKLGRQPDAPIELYDLAADIGESRNIAEQQPEATERIRQILARARTASELFPLPT